VAIRVAFCITELDPGGAERALFEVVTRLDPADWEVRVYCLGAETDLSRQLQHRGIATVCFGVRRWYQVGVLFRLTRALRAFQPEVLQTFLFHANILGRLAGWWAGVPVIFSGLRVAERGKRWHLWLDRWTNRLVSLNVCVSEGVRQFAVSDGGLSEQKLRVIPNGVDAERFASATPVDLSRFGIPGGAWTLVTVGRLTVQKGHDELIGAVAPLLVDDPRMHLLIVGEGPERVTLEWLSDSLGVSGQVHLSGFQGEIPGILKSCQAFALPSRWEGMPNALLEALAAGLPCIATDVEGVREILGSEAGLIVAPGDGVALRRAVEQVRVQMLCHASAESQGVVVKRHAWQAICEEYESLFSECLRRRGEGVV
jgi:glycosyltransferase involved in cell wall biosynthesis